jgi:hypothetical protein
LKGDFGMNENGGRKVIEELELDERLASSAQQSVRGLVASLPDEQVSMAWRSSLNERLLQSAAKKRRQRVLSWVLKPAFGLAVAGALATVIIMRQPAQEPTSVPPSSGAIEASIVAVHRENAAYSDMVGAGLAPVEATSDRTTKSVETAPDWNEVDIDTL